MVLDERSRHRLHTALQANLGDEEAATLMELLPPVGWADVATRRDLDNLEARLMGEIALVQGQIAAVQGRLERSDGRLRHEMANQTRTIVLALIATMVALASFVLAVGAFG